MSTKEILEKLKLTFNELVNNAAPVAPEAAAPEMIVPTKAKLADGTEVEISEMSVGGIVMINGAAAPVGDLTLEDSTVLTIGENGAITALVPSDSAAPMVEDMAKKLGMEEVFAAFEVSTNEKFASYETKFAEYESKLERATKVIEGLLSLTQTLAEAPTGVPDPIVTTTNNFNEQKKKSYDILFN